MSSRPKQGYRDDDTHQRGKRKILNIQEISLSG